MMRLRLTTAPIVSFGLALVPLPCSDARGQDEMDWTTLGNLLRAQHDSAYDEVSFLYEGSLRFTDAVEVDDDITVDGGLYKRYSGRFRASPRRGHYFIDLVIDYPGRGSIHKNTYSLRDDMLTIYGRDEDGRMPKLSTTEARFSAINFNEAYVVYPLDRLLRLLEDSRMTVHVTGRESIRGYTCDVFEIRFHSGLWEERGDGLFERWWIDFDRGGHILRREYYTPGRKLTSVVKDIQLQQFDVTPQRSAWLPVRGVVEYHDPDTGEVTSTTEVYALTNSVTFKEYEESDFVIDPPKASRRVAVGDDEGGGLMSDAEADAMLEEHLAELESQGNELQASSYSRGGGGWAWLYWASPAVSVIALAAVVVIYVRTRL